jgi:hypothetical protein
LNNKFKYLIITIFSITSLLNAQGNDVRKEKNLFQTVEYDINTAYYTGLRVFTAPLGFDKNEWITTGAVISSTAIEFIIELIRKIEIFGK